MVLCVKVLPRLTWVAFFIILLVWICLYGAGLKPWSPTNPVPLLSFHYFFMSLAWPVCMTEAILSYRAPLIPFKQRSSIKYLHVSLQTLVGIFIILGLASTTAFKEYSTERHYFSMHSWIGILAIAIYFSQYCAGFYAYIASSWPPARKAAFYSFHRWLGCLSLLSGLFAVTLGLAGSQIYDLWFTGFHTFDTPAVYATGSILIPVMGLLLFVQAIAVMLTHVVYEQQYLPAPVANKEGVLHAPNGSAA